MNKPDWKDSPTWANWLAQDEDGEYSWWNLTPKQSSVGCWSQDSPMDAYQYLEVGYGEKPEDWTTTLEPRP